MNTATDGQKAFQNHFSSLADASTVPLRADVCVHGSGWVAQAAALALDALGLKVALPQSAAQPSPQPDHRALALNPASRQLLHSLGAWPASASPVERMQVVDGPSQLDFEAPTNDAGDAGGGALAWIVPGADLTSALQTALASRPRLHWLPDGASGIDIDALLHLVCEGANSRLRSQLGIALQATPYGQMAVSATLQLAQAHGNTARQWFGATEPGEVIALLPMGNAHPNQAALVWSCSAAKAADLMAMDDAAFAETLAQVTQQASHHSAAPQLLHPRQTWPLAAATATRWMGAMPAKDRAGPTSTWLLMGDAAHRVHPLAGLGLNLGLGDVASLQAQLAKRQQEAYWRPANDAQLIKAHVRQRQAKAAQVFGMTDGLFLLQRGPGWGGEGAANALTKARQTGMVWLNRAAPLKNWLAQQAMR